MILHDHVHGDGYYGDYKDLCYKSMLILLMLMIVLMIVWMMWHIDETMQCHSLQATFDVGRWVCADNGMRWYTGLLSYFLQYG